MNRYFNLTILFQVLLVFVSLSPRVAEAQSRSNSASTSAAAVPQASLANSLTGEAHGDYTAAKLLFEDGDLAGAAVKFQRAYALSEDPRLLWNIAVCEKEQRHYAKASSLVSRYLKDAGPSLSSDTRKLAEATLASLMEFSSEIELENLPDGATVVVDGEEVGLAPLKSKLFLDLGAHKLEVLLPGYRTFVKALDIPGNNKVVLTVSLEKDESSAHLVVLTSVATSVISVDGKVLGSQRWEGSLASGKHQVRVTAKGKQTYTSEIELGANGSRTMDIVLKDKTKSPWPWIIGGAAVVAGAAVGGYFLLRDKDSEVDGPEGDLGSMRFQRSF